MTKSKYWVCGCATDNGEYLIEDQYSACVFCGARKSDCKEIVVPSGLGGVWDVAILEVADTRARVKVIKNLNGFNAMPPFWVEHNTIKRVVAR